MVICDITIVKRLQFLKGWKMVSIFLAMKYFLIKVCTYYSMWGFPGGAGAKEPTASARRYER